MSRFSLGLASLFAALVLSLIVYPHLIRSADFSWGFGGGSFVGVTSNAVGRLFEDNQSVEDEPESVGFAPASSDNSTSPTVSHSSYTHSTQSHSTTEEFEGFGMANPSAVYCEMLGYEFLVEEDELGVKGLCVMPDSTVCGSWDFLEGKCGIEHNWCALNGFQTRVVTGGGSLSPDYAICVDMDAADLASEGLIPEYEQSNSVIALTDLQEKSTIGEVDREAAPPAEGAGDFEPMDGSPPTFWDWRDALGANWETPVKNQRNCGSCWAFSAVSTVDLKYNLHYDNPGYDIDLSEQYLVSDCCSYCGDCDGGWKTSAMGYIRDSGITDESCYPYVYSDTPCSDRCGDWASRLYYLDGYSYAGSSSSNIQSAIIQHGAVAASFGWGSSYGGAFDSDGIYRCTSDFGTNHAISIVGFNESGQYWIIKNSWGSGWNGDGHLKIGYDECSIQGSVYYPIMYSDPRLTGTVSETSGTTNTYFNFTATYKHMEYNEPTSIQVVIDGSGYDMAEVDSADEDPRDNKTYSYETQLSEGYHSYYFTASDGDTTNQTPTQTDAILVTTADPLELNNPAVDPEIGTASDTYNFTVTYLHYDNLAPSYMQVVVDGSGNDMGGLGSSYDQGVVYYFEDSLGVGTHYFKYLASDGANPVENAGYSVRVHSTPSCSGTDPASSSTWVVDSDTTCTGQSFIPTNTQTGHVEIQDKILTLEASNVYVNHSSLYIEGILRLDGSCLDFVR